MAFPFLRSLPQRFAGFWRQDRLVFEMMNEPTAAAHLHKSSMIAAEGLQSGALLG